jgi:hypothetical protein
MSSELHKFTGFQDIRKPTQQEIQQLLKSNLPDDETYCDRLEESLKLHGVTESIDLLTILCEIQQYLNRNDEIALSKQTLADIDVLFQDCEYDVCFG